MHRVRFYWLLNLPDAALATALSGFLSNTGLQEGQQK